MFPPSRPFLIAGVLGSKNFFSKSCWEHPKTYCNNTASAILGPPSSHFDFYRWCGVAGVERVLPAPLGWYLYQLLQMLVLHYYLLLCPLPCPTNLCLTSQHSSISALMSDYGLQISTTNYAPRTPNLIRLIRIQ